MANAPKELAAGSAGACWRCVKHRKQASQIAWDGLRRYYATLDAVEAPLDLCVSEADVGGAESLLLGRAAPSPAASKTTRPQGGAVTEWYKGKTRLPIWRQIST
jgi:hypothetical protein